VVSPFQFMFHCISSCERTIALGNRFRRKLHRGLAIDKRHSVTVSKKFPELEMKRRATDSDVSETKKAA
jgi:hypothetical protein